jgi:hypothetical protein
LGCHAFWSKTIWPVVIWLTVNGTAHFHILLHSRGQH